MNDEVGPEGSAAEGLVTAGAAEPSPPTPGQNIDARAILAQARHDAHIYAADTEKATGRLHGSLAKILWLYEYGQENHEHALEVKVLLLEAEIPISDKTDPFGPTVKNRFTPLVKLVFPEQRANDKRNNISRYAAVLTRAHREGIKSDELPAFIGRNKGIAEIAKAEANRRAGQNQADADAKDAEARKRQLEAIPTLCGIEGMDEKQAYWVRYDPGEQGCFRAAQIKAAKLSKSRPSSSEGSPQNA